MSSHTMVVISTKKENYLPIMGKVIDALNIYIRRKITLASEKGGYPNQMCFLFAEENKEKWTNGCKLSSHDARCFTITFSIDGLHRRMFSTVSLPQDYHETMGEGEKIVFMLGSGEQSEEVMGIIAEAIKDFGKVFFTPNDSVTGLSLIKDKAQINPSTKDFYFF